MAHRRPVQIPSMSQELAYFVGFVATDGYVCKSGVAIELQVRDEQILRDIAEWLTPFGFQPKLTQRTTATGTYSRLQVHSRDLAEYLTSIGIYQAKSATIQWCEAIPENMIPHYLRGIFDGDGCLQLRRRQIEIAIYSKSLPFITSIVDRVGHLIGTNPKKIAEHARVLRAQFYSREAAALCELMYGNDPILVLRRKQEMFLSFERPTDPRDWSSAQLDDLRNNYVPGTQSWKEIADRTGKSLKAVSAMIWRMKKRGELRD